MHLNFPIFIQFKQNFTKSENFLIGRTLLIGNNKKMDNFCCKIYKFYENLYFE